MPESTTKIGSEIMFNIFDHKFDVRLTKSYLILKYVDLSFVFYIFSQQIHVLNILNMLHILRSFLFKMSFIS
jgi:hypothetical protein